MAKGTRFDLNEIRVAAKLSGMTERAQYALDSQVLKDTQPYVPRDTGMLMKSGESASELGKGSVKWSTPYAPFQYYRAPRKSGALNVKATMQWFEVSKKANMPRWIRVAKKAASRL